MRIGELGVWGIVDRFPAPEAADFARRIEAWGYSALWVPEAIGREPFSLLGYLAANTTKLILATGIASIYARDAVTMRATGKTLAELSDGRVVLGLGVSHAPFVTGVRGHAYEKPVTRMREYLEAMAAAPFASIEPKEDAPVVLAALRPKMLALAAERARGAHPYLVPPEHTARAREILGRDAWLCPEQKLLLETRPGPAREIARKAIAIYLTLPNYRNNLEWLGYGESDFAGGGSDRLVDALVAWGDERALAERVAAHRDAGADHVCIQALRPDGAPGPDLRLLEALAPGAG